MTRLHIHVGVDDLAASIRFYSTLFDAPPTLEKGDYAKWMIEDPRINFAISQGQGAHGIRHLGLQVEGADELKRIHERLSAAERRLIEEQDTTCCYARSTKSWSADPDGIVWESFFTHGDEVTYGGSPDLDELRHAPPPVCCAA